VHEQKYDENYDGSKPHPSDGDSSISSSVLGRVATCGVVQEREKRAPPRRSAATRSLSPHHVKASRATAYSWREEDHKHSAIAATLTHSLRRRHKCLDVKEAVMDRCECGAGFVLASVTLLAHF
jgi:hypothetical protein